jgi:drug/metabolite transporter (DMT)-like permease
VVTIIISVTVLKENAGTKGWWGISLALAAILLLSYRPADGITINGFVWLILAIIVFIMWGLQAYVIKLSASTMSSESITFYMMLSSVFFIPFALMMTDFKMPVNWGVSGMYSALIIQLLNAIGFLFFAYALKYGKAIIVVPMMSLAPVITVILSLILYSVVPHPVILTGMIIAFISIYLMAE